MILSTKSGNGFRSESKINNPCSRSLASQFRHADFTIRNLTRGAPRIIAVHEHQQRRNHHEESNYQVTCCGLVAPLAFGETGSKHRRHTTATTEAVTVAGTIAPTLGEGAAANYQPVKTLVIREDDSNNSGRYVVNGPGRMIDKWGQVIQTAIKPGSRVQVYYVNTGDSRVIDHVIVLD